MPAVYNTWYCTQQTRHDRRLKFEVDGRASLLLLIAARPSLQNDHENRRYAVIASISRRGSSETLDPPDL